MKTSRYELDPRGDVELVLQWPNRQHFAWLEEPATALKFPPAEKPQPELSEDLQLAPRLNAKRTLKLRKLEEKRRERARLERGGLERDERLGLREIGTSCESLGGETKGLAGLWNPRLDAGSSDAASDHTEVPSASEPLHKSPPEPAPESATDSTFELVSEHVTTDEPETHQTAGPQDEHNEPTFSVLGYDEEKDEMRVRVSSRHLSLASPVFGKMLGGPWSEGIPNSQSIRKIVTTEWDTEAFMVLLDIIHGHYRQVPRTVSLEMLGKITVLVDYYKCHEIVDLFIDLWIADLKGELPTSYGKPSTLWLCISSVFSRDDIFEAMATITIKESRGPPNTMELPLPEKLLVTIENNRVAAKTQLFEVLDGLRKSLCSGESCTDACSSMLLGSLIREMHQHGLIEGRPATPFLGYSVDGLSKTMLSFPTPEWSMTSRYGSHSYDCNLQKKMQPSVGRILKGLSNIKSMKDL